MLDCCNIIISFVVKDRTMDKKLSFKKGEAFSDVVAPIFILMVMMLGVFIIWGTHKAIDAEYVLIDALSTTLTSTGIMVWSSIKRKWSKSRRMNAMNVYIIIVTIMLIVEICLIIAAKSYKELYVIEYIKNSETYTKIARAEGVVTLFLMSALLVEPALISTNGNKVDKKKITMSGDEL